MNVLSEQNLLKTGEIKSKSKHIDASLMLIKTAIALYILQLNMAITLSDIYVANY